MKAVNLIPTDSRRRSRAGRPEMPTGPGTAVIALLGVALAFVTIYVLSANTISERKAKLANVQQQLSVVQARASQLERYTQFVKLAQQRAQTVRSLASSRFDWHAALEDLSRVVPAGTSLQSLLGTVAPGVTVNGPGGGTSGGANTSSLRGDIAAPAFEMKGCTTRQDAVARLLSRLRLIDGVTRVTLADSVKPDDPTVLTGQTRNPIGCPADQPSFDLVVFFAALPGEAAAGATPGAPGPGSTATLPASSTTTTSTTATTSTTPAAGGTPASTSAGGSR